MSLSKVDSLISDGKVSEAIALLHDGATEGDSEAKFRLGMLYYNGEHVLVDFDNAWSWFEKADKDKHAAAPYYIGQICTYYGDNKVPTESEFKEEKPSEEIAEGWYRVAMTWYRRSANRGYHRALTRVGYNFLRGIGAAPSQRKALACFLKGKSAGNIGAHILQARMLLRGSCGIGGILRGIFEVVKIFYSILKYRRTESVDQVHERFEY